MSEILLRSFYLHDTRVVMADVSYRDGPDTSLSLIQFMLTDLNIEYYCGKLESQKPEKVKCYLLHDAFRYDIPSPSINYSFDL